MSYLHCHNCGWDNGDFGLTEIKLRMLKWDLKDIIHPNYASHVKHPHFTILKFVCKDIVGVFRSLTQKYKTFEDFKNKNPDQICPKCGSKRLDVD